jgi:hypothetical protein
VTATPGYRRWSGALGACWLALAACAACGPSFQAVYEGDVQFEHCYGLDMGTATPEAKRSCWRTWVASYTYGQSRDRIDYAAKRLNQLAIDPAADVASTPSTLTPASAMTGGCRQSVPLLPKDAFVPPPNVSDGHADAGTPEPCPSVAQDSARNMR